MSNWAWFWIFMSVFVVCDTVLFLRGFDTFFWCYKTPSELEYQRKKLGLDEAAHPQSEVGK